MNDVSKLHTIAQKLVAPKKGILAADQSVGTMNKQLAALGIPEEAEMRRVYRQLLFTAPGIEEYVSGVIMYDSSVRNQTDAKVPFIDVLLGKGITPIIKVDKGTVPHTNFPGEVITQGLDDLSERLHEYYELGARAAKWRAVFTIGEGIPSEENILFDMFSMARYAALCQEAGIVPIVEPEVLFSGNHDIGWAEAVTTNVLRALFDTLYKYRINLEGLILKSSMVLAGDMQEHQSTPQEVADATLRTFHASVPHEVPGIVFLSGGQSPERATANLNEIASRGQQPWELAFSFSRGIEQPVQEAWAGIPENIEAAQQKLIERLKLNVLADQGQYMPSMEGQTV